jgi:hypothetical protein
MVTHSSDGDGPTEDRTLHRPKSGDPNRMLSRSSPVTESETGLVSRDWQPRHGGPELIAAWPLGHPPERYGDDEWDVPPGETVLQRNVFHLPYTGGVDYAPLYINVVGRAYHDSGDELTLTLDCEHLSGDEFTSSVDLTTESEEPFVSPMVEFTPEVESYTSLGRIFGEYSLTVTADTAGGHVNQGTGVHLWSE